MLKMTRDELLKREEMAFRLKISRENLKTIQNAVSAVLAYRVAINTAWRERAWNEATNCAAIDDKPQR